ncbi:MAG: TonB C-terminal domain-containing protein [Candidatus Oxydemutatoraceae bacterium WSBS_2016_MAG_OTU14]
MLNQLGEFIQKLKPWAFSLALHGVVLTFFLTGFVAFEVDGRYLPQENTTEKIVMAKTITAAEIEAMFERKKALKREKREKFERKEREKKQQAERTRQATLTKKREQAKIEEAKRKKVERAKRETIIKQEQEQQEQERIKREQAILLEEDRKQDELERIEQQRQAQEEQLRQERKAVQDAAEASRLQEQMLRWRNQYAVDIRRSVERQWRKPPASIVGGDCVVKIRQDKKGSLLEVKVVECKGDKLYQRSVKEAVYKAAPLPLAPSSEVFSDEIEFTFRRQY